MFSSERMSMVYIIEELCKQDKNISIYLGGIFSEISLHFDSDEYYYDILKGRNTTFVHCFHSLEENFETGDRSMKLHWAHEKNNKITSYPPSYRPVDEIKKSLSNTFKDHIRNIHMCFFSYISMYNKLDKNIVITYDNFDVVKFLNKEEVDENRKPFNMEEAEAARESFFELTRTVPVLPDGGLFLLWRPFTLGEL